MAAVEGGFMQQPAFRGNFNMTILESMTTQKTTITMNPPQDRHDLPPRPPSALMRGIQITQFKDAKVNPEPVSLEETDLLLEEYLSPRKLRALTGVEDLHEVKYLEMKVNTEDTSLGNFGAHLPLLSQLKLSNSLINSVRDLGSSLNCLQVLWMARSAVQDLDGLSSMNNLRELYLAYNEICDISPCSLLENLTTLDLEGNNIDEISQIHFLSCLSLKNLTLEGNPVCVTPTPDEASPAYDYREVIKQAIPDLEMLDDEPFSPESRQSEPRKTASVFDDDWALIDELLQEVTIQGSEDIDIAGVNQSSRPATSQRPTTSYRPGTSYAGTGLRPGTRSGHRPGTSLRLGTARTTTGRPSSRAGTARQNSASARPDSGRLSSAEGVDNTDDGSDLTRGGVVCGNPSKALRARHKPNTIQSRTAAKMLAEVKQKTATSFHPSADDQSLQAELFTELTEWRKSYAEKQKIIAESKVAQVLTIDHDAAVLLSDDEGSITSDEDDVTNQYSASNVHDVHISNSRCGVQANGDNADNPRLLACPASETHNTNFRPRSRSKGRYDESFDAPEDSSTDTSVHRFPVSHRMEPMMDKTKPKMIRSSVRSPLESPESRGSTGGEVSLGPVIPPPGRRHRGLKNLQLLPSKFTK